MKAKFKQADMTSELPQQSETQVPPVASENAGAPVAKSMPVREAALVTGEGAPAREAAAPTEAKAASGGSFRKRIAFVLVPLALAAALYYGYNYWIFGRFQISTDDAYIHADIATLSTKVSGYVASVDVVDNAHVKAGDVIARIDDGDYALAVQTAKDRIAVQQATIERIARQVTAQEANIEQAKAQFTASEADAKRAKLELDRQKDLATRDFSSRQTLEQAEANNIRATATVASGKASIDAATASAEVLKAEKLEAERTLNQLQTALAQSERDLSFTVVKAPFDGVIGNRAVQKGDYVQPSQRLASLVALDHVYIDANFKETQLGRLRSGQHVEITVDAMPDHKFAGDVVSFSPASGSVFSLLPPENATGNFTKIVQRLPVRVRVTQHPEESDVLRPGMSVVVSVNTKDDAKDQPRTARSDAVPVSPVAAR